MKILDFIITKIERHTKDEIKKETLRNILNEIDKYKKNKYGLITLRYYKYKVIEIDELKGGSDD
jgi:hypothetical protein